MKRKPRQPLERQTIVKAIGREPTIETKLGRAIGKKITVEALADELDAAAIVDRSRWLATINRNAVRLPHVVSIGVAIINAINRNDHAAIQRLAVQVQYGKRKESESKIHRLILTFCHCHDCGTHRNPAPAKALLSYLQDHRCSFSRTHPTDIPRTLVKTCEKIGVWLAHR